MRGWRRSLVFMPTLREARLLPGSECGVNAGHVEFCSRFLRRSGSETALVRQRVTQKRPSADVVVFLTSAIFCNFVDGSGLRAVLTSASVTRWNRGFPRNVTVRWGARPQWQKECQKVGSICGLVARFPAARRQTPQLGLFHARQSVEHIAHIFPRVNPTPGAT